MYEIVFSEEAVRELAGLKKADLRGYQKFERLLPVLREHPYTGTGRPHRLSFVEGIWSRNLGKTHRLHYLVSDSPKRVTVLSAFGHYLGN